MPQHALVGTLTATPAMVWRMWTTPDGIRRWWFTEDTEIVPGSIHTDIRVGGGIHSDLQIADTGDILHYEANILDIEVDRALSLRLASGTRIYVRLQPHGEQHSKLTVHVFADTTDEDLFAAVLRGWSEMLRRLAHVLKT